jgi:FG-GAP-like repeat/Bacterial Ig-like domain
MPDTTAPTVVSFVRADAALTNASQVHYTLTFSEAVTGVTADQFSLVRTGTLTGGSVASVAEVLGSAASQYTVTVATGTGDGTLELDLTGSGVRDLAGNALPVATFGTASTYGGGNGFVSFAVADVNGDTRPDIVTAGYFGTNNDVHVLLGQAGGVFGAAVAYAAGGIQPYDVAVADVNGDARPDLITANYGSNSISVLFGQSDGTFSAADTYSVGGQRPYSIAVADLNGDTMLDIVTNNVNSNTVSVLLGQAAGRYSAAVSYGVGRGPLDIAIADLNGDARPDIVTANNGANTISVLFGQLDGTFGASVPFGVGGYHPESVAIADINGDAILDVIITKEPLNNPS